MNANNDITSSTIKYIISTKYNISKSFWYRSNFSIQLLDQWELSIWRKQCHNDYYAIRTSAVSSITIQPLLS
jgi:hypothetical protein